MKFYLSSYKIGNEAATLQKFLTGKKIGFVPNAGDFTKADAAISERIRKEDTAALNELGIDVEFLDLRTYFGKKEALRAKLGELDGIWVRGGNTFALRQAMKLSGMDELLTQELINRDDFVYAGYSAAGCVLSPSLRCYQIVDHPETPYAECTEISWDGLGLIDYAFMPHFDSNHHESADIDKEIRLCEEKDIPYKAIRDGEVLIF